MAWQNFIYSYLHAMADAGTDAISAANTFSTTQPKGFLIDFRAGSLCTFTAAAADHHIQLDRGAGTPDAITRCIIPIGHNLDGVEVRVRAADDSGITANVTTLVNSVTADDGLFDQSFTSNAQRYVRMDFPNDNFNPEIGEIVYTYAHTPSVGPEPPWTDMLVHNVLEFQKSSGVVSSLSLGSDRRLIEVRYRHVDSSADLTIFSGLLTACGRSRPFWLDRPWDDLDAIWVRLTEDSRQQLDRASPGSPDSQRPQIELSMLEHLA